MKKLLIMLLVKLVILFQVALLFLVFMYFFTRPAKPIMEYEFPIMTYQELETRISKQKPIKLWDDIHFNKEKFNDSTAFRTRFVIIGKDSLRFDFVTYKDEEYRYKTKHRHSNKDLPWIEILGVRNSMGKGLSISYKNKDEYSEVIKLFEDEFIKKINNGKVNVIKRNLWDWFIIEILRIQ